MSTNNKLKQKLTLIYKGYGMEVTKQRCIVRTH